MLYWLHQFFSGIDFPGHHLLDYITFRAGICFALSLIFALVAGEKIIRKLQVLKFGEVIRDLDLEGQTKKTGTPTMGGIIIILAILIPCLLLGNLSNVYMILMLVTTIWMGTIGFLDDYRKIKYHNKEGLKGRYKIVGQVGLGLIVGLTMWLSPDIVMNKNAEVVDVSTTEVEVVYSPEELKTPETTIPFVKNHNFNYQWITSWIGNKYAARTLGWIVFVLVVVMAVTAVSNGANLTDGLDGLCAGVSAVIGTALVIMAYLGSNVIYSSYLNIMYIPGSEELVVYAAAFIGALVGFLWYNAHPAQVFMGDTGSLTLGAIIAVFAILIRKELLIPLLCIIFFLEDLSVILQSGWFRYTRIHRGEGQRILKMAPLHHHFQKGGDASIKSLVNIPKSPMPESRVVIRFWIVAILFAVLTFVTLKVR